MKTSRCFRGESSFKTWFYRIVINLCRRHHRRSRIIRFTSLSFLTKGGEEREMDIEVASTPEDEASANQTGASINLAIKKLSMKQREVFILKHMKGLKIGEIASVMGCSDGTVKSRHCASAYAQLKTDLDGIKPTEPELPDSFWPSYNRKLYSRIEKKSASQRWTLFGPRFIQVGVMALLLIFLGIGGMKLYEAREERAFISENYALMSSMELLEEFDLMQSLDEIESVEG